MIYTEDDLRLEDQVRRCRVAIDEYFRAKQIHIDYKALYAKLEPYPMLFQFAHMIAYLKVDWKDALRWCIEHRGEIMEHDRKTNEQKSNAPTETNGADDRNDAISAHKG